MFIMDAKLDSIGFKEDDLYVCDKEEALELQLNGFSLLSANYDKNYFYFVNTDELKKYLKKGGG